jgi:diguanylate cyclase (GGDEF)-like protein
VSPERERLRIEAFRLALDVQAAVPGAAEAIGRLLETGRSQDWPEVFRAGLFAAAVAATATDYEQTLPAINRLLAQAESDGDYAMTAIALAMRSSTDTTASAASAAVDAEADLARATVLLESGGGNALDRITAHNECAQAYCDRWLWELGDEQFAIALELAPDDSPAWLQLVLPAIVYNRAEMQVDWACALVQLRDTEGVAERWRTLADVMTTATNIDIPDQWRTELRAFELLLGAIAGHDTAGPAAELLQQLSPEEHPRAWPIGHLHLAIAINERGAGNLPAAMLAAEAAVASIDPHGSPDTYDLALSISVGVEAEEGRAAGLRYGLRQIDRRSANRVAALGSMRSRLQAERLKREHDLLTRHAHLDDLTGLSNRRGYERYIAAIGHQRIERIVLLVADLDDFKGVNDRFGHATGDAVLVTVARVLEASVRQADCAVRLGGDEFAVVLAATDLEVARLRAESVMDTVGQQDWGAIAAGLDVSLSIGLAAGDLSAIQELITQADAALYEAKAAGGRRIVAHSSRRLAASDGQDA